MLALIIILLWTFLLTSQALLVPPTLSCCRNPFLRPQPASVRCSGKTDDDDDQAFPDNDNDLLFRPEQSRLNDYVSKYLQRETEESSSSTTGISSQDVVLTDPASATHLIAIPMDTCVELLLELESVQRAILYHCPILTDACIPGAVTRMPLLYVKTGRVKSAQATQILSQLVRTLVQKYLFDDGSSNTMMDNEEEDDQDLLNADGYRPLTMTFQSLEIDGSNNNVLHTVGVAGDRGTTKLSTFVQQLKMAIEEQGWQTLYPPDPAGNGTFRPRIPFMELPKDFDENLSRFKDAETVIPEEDYEFLTSSEGGNGISPIFWCQWWDDVFGRNIRLKEIGIYPRSSQATDLSYSMFYMPYDTIALPEASSAMMRTELKFQQYQDERMQEQEQQMGQAIDAPTASGLASGSKGNDNGDELLARTQQRLEQLYRDSQAEETGLLELGDTLQNEKASKGEVEGNQNDALFAGDLVKPYKEPTSGSDFMDDWMKEKIRQAIESQESEQARKPIEKEMPPIAENPIFKAYKEGTLVPKTTSSKSQQQDPGPYPSRGHFVGIWKVVSSPTGFPVEESSNESSENLILRIDGTTAGGPILDPETRQKAAGGTWKIIEEEDGEVQLRIRLVIPPKRERVIEMIGSVNRISLSNQLPMASKAFGIPHLEALAKMPSSDLEDFMICGGDVYVEDCVTKKNRERIGEFSLTKIQGPKSRGEYTITIPKPI
jgi:hypothetical protein